MDRYSHILICKLNRGSAVLYSNLIIMESKDEKRLDADNELIISSGLESAQPDKPVNEEINGGYNSANDTGNSNEDLELNPNDDPETNVDEYDLEALNGQDLDEEDSDLV